MKEGASGFKSILERYEPVIGLEVHCQLKTKSKLFCSCKTQFGAAPNQNTCPVCLGLPGVLPLLNKQAVDYAVLMAVAVEAKTREKSVFSRKQYFYPDLPKGYQITQYDLPYCENGRLQLDSGRTIPIERIHMEEDAGKNVHGDNASYVDLNRAGIPLLEIVSAPAIQGPQEAHEYLRKLRAIVRYLDISDGNMEEGSIRCDANVSIRLRGEKKLGTRTEIKNLNSFKNVERAITYEIFRQADLLDNGEKVRQVTLLFDTASGRTQVMRSKEDSPDYRYFPEPDLGLVLIDNARLSRIKASIPELPAQKQIRFQAAYGLSEDDALQLTDEKELADFFEAILQRVESKVAPKIVANWVLSEYLREHNARQWTWDRPIINADNFASLLRYLGDGTISGKIAKGVFESMSESGASATSIIEAQGLIQINDEDAIRSIAKKVVTENREQVVLYLSGKEKVLGFLVGQIMKISQGRFNPGLANQYLKEAIDEFSRGA